MVKAILINGNYAVNRVPEGTIDFLLEGSYVNGVLQFETLSAKYPHEVEDVLNYVFKLKAESEVNFEEIGHEKYYQKYMKDNLSRILGGMKVSGMLEIQLGYLFTQVGYIVIRLSEYAVTIYRPKVLTDKQLNALELVYPFLPKDELCFYSITEIERRKSKDLAFDYVNKIEDQGIDTLKNFVNKERKNKIVKGSKK